MFSKTFYELTFILKHINTGSRVRIGNHNAVPGLAAATIAIAIADLKKLNSCVHLSFVESVEDAHYVRLSGFFRAEPNPLFYCKVFSTINILYQK